MLACIVGVARAAPDANWYLHSSFRELYARALISSATTLGSDYDRLLRSGETGDVLESIFKACVRHHPAGVGGEYTVVGFVLQDGRLVNTQVSPADALAICTGRGLAGFAFPAPPAGYAPYAVAFKFDGKTTKQISPFPPTNRPPPPPSSG